MKTDQELEQLMRATFTGRANTVTRGPAWAPGYPGQAPEPHKPQHRWVAALAAAAAVVAVVASVSVIRDHRSQPANHVTPTPSVTPTPTTGPTGISTTPTPSSTPTSPTVNNTIPLACSTALPTAWQTALANSVVDLGSATPSTATAFPLGTTSDDGIIASVDDGPTPGSARKVVLLEANHAPKTLYTQSDPDHYGIASADISGNWLVVGVQNQVRPGKGVVGGNTPNVIDAVVAVDLTTGRSKIVVASPDYLKSGVSPDTGIAIVNDVVFDGKIYWSQRPSDTATTGTVKSFDLTSGTTRVLTDTTGYLIRATEGVVINPQFGSSQLLVHATLPATVAAAMTPFALSHLGTDGTAYAWAVDQTTVGWWRPGQAAPKYLRIPGGFDTDDSGGTPLVAGNYLIELQTGSAGSAQFITDALTGANAPIADAYFHPNVRGDLMFGSNGYMFGEATTDVTAHYVNGYWLDTPSDVVRIDTTSLPKLTC